MQERTYNRRSYTEGLYPLKVVEKPDYLILGGRFGVDVFRHKFPEKFCSGLKVPGRGGVEIWGVPPGMGVWGSFCRNEMKGGDDRGKR